MPKRPGTPQGPTKEFTDPPDLAGLIRPFPPIPLWDPQFDAASFDELLQNRGLRWIHEKAAYCPNVSDLEVQVHDPNCQDCENGYYFFPANEGKPIYGAFYQNKLERLYEINGLWEAGDAVITFTSYNRGGPDNQGEPSQGSMNDFKVGDKLTCLDYVFTWQERIEHSPSGVDRLKYPAKEVEFVADRERRYQLGTDFEITPQGHIAWLTPNRPKFNQLRNQGGIYTIVYTANPVFYVMQLLHEIRATKGVDRETGALQAIRLPQQVLVRRDYFFKHPDDKTGPASSRAPRNGSLVTPE